MACLLKEKIREFWAGAVIYNPKKEILLIQKKEDADKNINDWGLPGGKLNANENEEAGARREVLEETGLTPIEFKKISDTQYTRINLLKFKKDIQRVIVYLCPVDSFTNLKLSIEEIAAGRIISIHEITSKETTKMIKPKFIPSILEATKQIKT